MGRRKKMEKSEDEFEVEAIREFRVDPKRGKLYLIKWKGYPDKDNTWEPLGNINMSDPEMQKMVDEAESASRRKGEEPPVKKRRIKRPASDGSEDDESKAAPPPADSHSSSPPKSEPRRESGDVANAPTSALVPASPRTGGEPQSARKNDRLLYFSDVQDSPNPAIAETASISHVRTYEDAEGFGVRLHWPDGSAAWVNRSWARKYCPQALLDFYESRLTFGSIKKKSVSGAQ